MPVLGVFCVFMPVFLKISYFGGLFSKKTLFSVKITIFNTSSYKPNATKNATNLKSNANKNTLNGKRKSQNARSPAKQE